MTVASLLKGQGYETAMFGKWHIGMEMPKKGKMSWKGTLEGVDWSGEIKGGPRDLGFDYFYGISASLDMPPYIYIENNRFVGEATVLKEPHPNRKGPAHKDFEVIDVLDDLAEKSVEYIKAQSGEKPFFAYLSLPSPHTPIVPTPEWQGQSGLGDYGDFMMQTDDFVGTIVAALEEKGFTENTLLIISSDNGCSYAQADVAGMEAEGHYPSARFRGYKADIWEGGHRVPFLVKWPARVKAGSTSGELICLTDFMATCADLSGAALPEDAGEDSVSFLPALEGERIETSRKGIIHHSIKGHFAYREGRWKLILSRTSGGFKMENPGKDAPRGQLYDLENDPGETDNLYSSRPEVVKSLLAQLEAYVTAGRRYGDLGCYGSPLKTPAIDKLAEDGLRSTDCLVGANVCGPSRAALMTGRYPMRAGHPISRHDTPKYEHYGIAPEEITIAEQLKDAGYYTKMVGKWHLGFHVEGSHPLDAGFDDYLGLHSNYSDKLGDADTIYHNHDVVEEKVRFEKVTKLYTDEVVSFIKGEHEKPFFVYFAHHIAHDPVLPSKPFKGKAGKKAGKFGDFLLELDDSVGRVRAAVEEAGIAENTLIVFLSDNGPARHGSAKPLRGGKYVTMEGGHRVPGIFLWPGRIPAGQVSDAMITSMDLLPLFSDLAGVELPTDRKIDGKNILDLLTGKSTVSPHEYYYYYNGLNLQGVRTEKWKLQLPRRIEDQPYWARKETPSKPYLSLKEPMLFDMKKDIGEKNDVISSHPEVAAEMEKEADRARAELGDIDQTDVQRPNVIFILMDDMGYGDVSCYGATKVSTPNIDRMAAEGIRFTDFHTGASICSPSRAAYLTGAYPQRNGLYLGINPKREAHWFLGLDPGEITIAEQFKKQGYTTAMVGKWHLGMEEKFSYFHQGFDHYYGAPENMGHSSLFYDEDKVIYKNTPLDKLTTLYTERMVKNIRDFKDEPFFIYFAHNYPHTPYKAGPKFKGSSEDGVRGDIIQEADWGIGEILGALEDNGILENTLVIFASDNGPTSEEYSEPYSGTKYVTLEGGHRVPFIFYWKGRIEPSESDVPVIAMDLFPTLSELIGAPLPKDRIYDGVSLVPLLSGGALARPEDEPFYYYNCENLQAVRVGNWKLHLPREAEQIPWWGRRLQGPLETPKLFNLAEDAAEENDVANQNPERVSEMMALAEKAREKLGEFGKRGSEQRPTGTLFPEVPILSNEAQDWAKLTDEEKGRAKTEFKHGKKKRNAVTVAISAAAEKPNFVIILTDDQGYQDLGCYGSPDIKTPNIDRMAREGMRFTDFYAQTVCGPSRASLLTGSYPMRTERDPGDNGLMPHPALSLNEVTIAEILKPLGYRTSMIGKWDLSGRPKTFNIDLNPGNQGFDESFWTETSSDGPIREGAGIKIKRPDRSSLTRLYTDKAIDFVERSEDQPFFLYLAHVMPHTKLAVSKEFKGKSKAGLYGDVIEELDYNVGRLLSRIKELGLDDNTYVIFTSDNGPWWIRRPDAGHAEPLRSAKTSTYEGGLRVPFIIRAPGRVPAGKTLDLVCASIDLMPTIAGITGAELPDDRVIDGLDISAVFHGTQTELKRPYFYYQHQALRAVRQGDWKLHLPHSEADRSKEGKEWQSHVPPEDRPYIEKPTLYNLAEDIGETTNVADKYPEIVVELMKELDFAKEDIGYHDRIGENSHDQGYADLGCFGGKNVYTPNIDRMAQEGMRLTSFYVAAPLCTPSRAALMTGCYPKRIDMDIPSSLVVDAPGLPEGVRFPVCLAADGRGLNPGEVTIAEIAQSAGYKTGMFGKWHLGDQPEFLPTRQGFGEFFGLPYSHDISPKHPRQKYFKFPALPLLEGEKVIELNPDSSTLTKRFTERGVDFIKRNKDKNFFLYLPHAMPHGPLAASQQARKAHAEALKNGAEGKKDLFASAIYEIDWSVGEILKTLKEEGIDDNTIVLFSSDNGPAKGSAKPLSGKKGSTLEGGQRVPTVIRWPGGIPAGSENGELLTAMDILPTFAKLAGAELPTDREIDGKDIMPVLAEGSDSPHESFFYTHWGKTEGVRRGGWKLRIADGREALYNLETDISENNNVASEHPEVVQQLKAAMKEFDERMARQDKKPNFVIIFTDDQGYQDVGCFGSPDIKTPRLDKMAEEGMRFTSFYAQTVCGPSRAALMTGCYPLRLARHGDPDSIHPEMHTDEITIAEVLKTQGYATAAFGKWDLAGHSPMDFVPELLPVHQGFDTYFGTPGSNDKVVSLIRGARMIEKNADMATLTERYTDEALGFLENHRDQPFFVYLAHTMPHTKLAASRAFKGKSAAGLYGDVIEELDYHIGRVLDKISELGLDENTYVIFTSDNGPWLIRKEDGGHAEPLRSGKTSFWEGGLRVPCIMRAPGKIPAGETCDAIAATIDLMPTLARLAGTTAPTDRVIDGVDISALMHGDAEMLDRSYFYYQHDCLRAVRDGKWKLLVPHTEPSSGSIASKWSNHIAKEDAVRISQPQLYDLEADIGETTDVSADYPEIVAELMKLATKARNDIGDHDVFGENARTLGAERRTLSTEAEKPNVVLIFADDLGYGDLGCYGATKLQTPNIDKLAAEGKKFTDAHSASAVCTPSRYGLLTGEYPIRANNGKGVWGPAPITEPLIIDTEMFTLADVFKSSGYDTAAFGKWHLGFKNGKNDWQEPLSPGPRDLGFDYYFGMPVVNSAPPYVYVENESIVGGDSEDPLVHLGRGSKETPTPITPIPPEAAQRSDNQFKGAVKAHELFNDYEVGTKLTEKATEWIKSREKKPFFLYFATTNVHHPFTPAERFQGTSQAGPYGDFVHELDWIVGEVRKSLEEAGVADNTLIIFTSDNGGMFNHGGRHAAELGHKINGDLLGSKFGIWEGGHRVPFIAWWPGKIEGGSVSGQMLNSVDLLATFADVTGKDLSDEQRKDSINMLPALTGNPEEQLRTEMVVTPHKPSHTGVRKAELHAELTVSSLFTDHAVLQRDTNVPVWGTAEAGQTITVDFSGIRKSVVAGEDGRWKVDLDPLPADNEGRDLLISDGEEELGFSDIVVGEVWICSGQSNMQMGYGAVPEIKALLPEAGNLRSFEVKRTVAFTEQERCEGEWLTQPPDSAVAFAFAHFLEKDAGVPVGIIHTSWGSSSIEAWMPRDMVETVPHFKMMMEEFDADTATREKIQAILDGPRPWAKGDDVFLRRQTNILYNAMMAPLAPFACRGLVWYQGERNTQSMEGMLREPWFSRNSGMLVYGDVLQKLVKRLRKEWGNDEMHFLAVMLPGYGQVLPGGPDESPRSPVAHSWAWMRESQLKVLDLKHSGVANTIDLGDMKNIHPKDKLPVGRRLALLAARDTLGKDVAAEGPIKSSVEKRGDSLVVHFKQAEGMKTKDGEDPAGFWVADASGKWVAARARIEGQSVVLAAPGLANPEYVRYAFAGMPEVNLVNAAGLPAYPFRTDSFQPGVAARPSSDAKGADRTPDR
eukprot:g4144.t1